MQWVLVMYMMYFVVVTLLRCYFSCNTAALLRYRPDATSRKRLTHSALASVHAPVCTRVCFTREFTHTHVYYTREFSPYSRVLHSRVYTHILEVSLVYRVCIHTWLLIQTIVISEFAGIARCIYTHSTI